MEETANLQAPGSPGACYYHRMASFGRKRAAATPAPETTPETPAQAETETAPADTEAARTDPMPATPARLHSVDDEW